MYNKFKKKEKKKFFKVNYQIRSPFVRVIKDEKQLGILPVDKARKAAQDANLDLVEIVPDAKPPVCRIINFDKFRYQQNQKDKELKKKQKLNDSKQIRLRPSIQDHDIETKVNAIKRFLIDGKKVSLNMQFKSRELMHKDRGFAVIKTIFDRLASLASMEIAPKFEGNRLICRLSPVADVGDKNAS